MSLPTRGQALHFRRLKAKLCLVQPTCCGQQEEDLEACQRQLFNWREAPRYTASQHAVWRRFHGSKAEEIDIVLLEILSLHKFDLFHCAVI